MSEDLLSAMLDGECSPEEMDRLLRQMEGDPELAMRWSRLCASRDIARGVRLGQNQPCICDGVMNGLKQGSSASENVVDLAVHRASKPMAFPRPAMHLLRPAAGLFAAASMGAAAVLVLQPGDETVPVPVAEQPRFVLANQAQETAEEQAYREMLRDYMLDHSHSVADQGVGGTLRYARFAAHNAAYRPQPGE
ncbi:MAG: sigma-E factor negative regulatory protein [Panacagrimonas sp.]